MTFTNTKMPIPLNSLTEEVKHFLFKKNAPDFSLKIAKEIKSFDLEAKIHAVGPHFQLNGSLEAETDLICGLCTESFRFKIKETFQEILAPQWAKKMQKTEDIKEFFEAEVELINGLEEEDFYIDTYANELILFAIPAHPKCSESCKGLCSSCGANLNQGDCSCDKEHHIGHIGLEALKNIKIDNKH